MAFFRAHAPVPVFVTLVCSLVGGAGCSREGVPELAEVTGVITLDGHPVPNAVVFFAPEGRKGRTVLGVTGPKGEYSLQYAEGMPGASLGRHSVRISTAAADGSDREKIPSRFSLKDSLFADVKAGTNTLDFDLESQP